MINLLTQLVVLGQSGVYALINEGDKRVQIYGSINMLEHMSHLIKKMETGECEMLKVDLNSLDIVVLDYTKDIRIIQSYWIKYYRNMGYKMYKESYLPDYKIKGSLSSIKNILQYVVYLENKNEDRIVLGRFNTKEEGEVWRKETYPGDIVNKVVYKDLDKK